MLLWAIFLLTACNEKKTATLTNISPNKKVTTTVTASRTNTVDAWKIIINVNAYTFKDQKLNLELYADDINDQNVKFDWQDNSNCIITFQQREAKPRTFHLKADPNQLQLAEM
jgi:hypothetical protein